MEIINYSAQHYIDKIKNGEHFSFTRWGDGEWFCAVGVEGKNCDKHIYFPEMKLGLNEALINNKGYYKAIWETEHSIIKNNLNLIVKHMQKTGATKGWVNAVVWEDLVIRYDINELTEVLENKNFVIVSSDDKRRLNLKYTDFIEIPSINCFLEKDRIKEEMKMMVNKYDNPIFGMSASMATNVIVDELYPEIGHKCTMIDFGSIWDPFVGKITRSYHKEYKKNKF